MTRLRGHFCSAESEDLPLFHLLSSRVPCSCLNMNTSLEQVLHFLLLSSQSPGLFISTCLCLGNDYVILHHFLLFHFFNAFLLLTLTSSICQGFLELSKNVSTKTMGEIASSSSLLLMTCCIVISLLYYIERLLSKIQNDTCDSKTAQ